MPSTDVVIEFVSVMLLQLQEARQSVTAQENLVESQREATEAQRDSAYAQERLATTQSEQLDRDEETAEQSAMLSKLSAWAQTRANIAQLKHSQFQIKQGLMGSPLQELADLGKKYMAEIQASIDELEAIKDPIKEEKRRNLFYHLWQRQQGRGDGGDADAEDARDEEDEEESVE